MGAVRAAIQKGAPVAEVRHEISALDTLFTDAEQVLAPEQASSTSAFVGALTILLREGLEALLVVIAIVAFLRKAERSEEHTSELQSLMRISYAVFCLKKTTYKTTAKRRKPQRLPTNTDHNGSKPVDPLQH